MNEASGRVRAGYDQDPAREWQRLEGGAQARLEWAVTRHVLARHLDPPDRQPHLLDAGGGPGRYTLALAEEGYRITLLDLSPALLDLARTRLAAAPIIVRARVVGIEEGTIADLGRFPAHHFDAILCLGGPLSHLPKPAARQQALAEFRRTLRPEGLLFVGVFSRLAGFRSVVQWPQSWPQLFAPLVESGHTRMGPGGIPAYSFYPEEFVGELAHAGFTVQALYGCQGLGAGLQEDHLLALMDNPEHWAAWRQVLLDTCGHANIIGVSNHILAVATANSA